MQNFKMNSDTTDYLSISGNLPVVFDLYIPTLLEDYKDRMREAELSAYPITKEKVRAFVRDELGSDWGPIDDSYNVYLETALNDTQFDIFSEKVYTVFKECEWDSADNC